MPLPWTIFYGINAGFLLLILVIASIQDLKFRAVYDWVWIVGACGGILFQAGAIFIWKFYSWQKFLLNCGLALIFLFLFWFPRLFHQSMLMGPADLLAIGVMALCLPVNSPFVNYSITTLYIIPEIFNIITNSFLLFLFYIMGNTVGNLIQYIRKNVPPTRDFFSEFSSDFSCWKKIMLFMIGHRLPLRRLPDSRFIKLLEFRDFELNQWVVVFDLSYGDDWTKDDLTQIQAEYRELDMEYIWISFMIPLVLFFLGGVILNIWMGNALFQFLSLFL